jgi:polyisoprenoid-binding protein YceI
MRILRVGLIWVLLLAVASPMCLARSTTYEVSHLFSNVSFSIMKFFFKEEGGFRDYSGDISYDPDHPESSSVKILIQAGSIDTRIDGRDRVLRSDDFLDVERYPSLTFASTAVVPESGGMLNVTGDLTIRGVTRQITVPVKLLGTKTMQGYGEFAGFDAVFTIDRTEFGVNGSRWSGGNLILSKEVTIHLAIGGIKPGSK